MAQNGTPVLELLAMLGLMALTLVRVLAATSVLRTAMPLRKELELEGISRAVGKFSKLVLLHKVLNADTT